MDWLGIQRWFSACDFTVTRRPTSSGGWMWWADTHYLINSPGREYAMVPEEGLYCLNGESWMAESVDFGPGRAGNPGGIVSGVRESAGAAACEAAAGHTPPVRCARREPTFGLRRSTQDGEASLVVEVVDREPDGVRSLAGLSSWGLDRLEMGGREVEEHFSGRGATEALVRKA
jgi:hypothetical protein